MSSHLKMSSMTVPELHETPFSDLLDSFLGLAMAKGYGLACWQTPDSCVSRMILDLEGGSSVSPAGIGELLPGFLVGSYAADEAGELMYLKGDIRVSSNETQIMASAAATEINLQNELAGIADAAFLERKDEPGIPSGSTTEDEYMSSVHRALEDICSGELEKIVLSRVAVEAAGEDPSPGRLFEKIGEIDPGALTSLVYLPAKGLWIGASPELLAGQNADGLFTTVALAGTQLAPPDVKPGDAVWKQKEIEEQALVSRYIINCFKKIRLRDFDENGPRTVRAGRLFHLKTEYRVDTDSLELPDLLGVMLELLHPTSAVCGMPRDAALAFIKKNEGHSRRLYSGFLGPVNDVGSTALYVNLRCMQLAGDKAILYAGAGITRDSDPAAEWQETENKLESLRSIMRGAADESGADF